ncbi:MAG: hypothetical protein OXG35_05760 [Acidobacteria bacterium]|nr:hypothetical protein [Acidobacteriota bacterium]
MELDSRELAISSDGRGRRLVERPLPGRETGERAPEARWVGRLVDVEQLRARRERSHTGRRDRTRGREESRSQAERLEAVLDLLADLRVVSFRNLQEQAFAGHPYAARRGVRALVDQGLVEVREIEPAGRAKGKASGHRGFKVAALTEAGARAVRARRRRKGSDARVWEGFVRARELAHDAGVSELVLETVERVKEVGGRVVRVRMEADLKAGVARAEKRCPGGRAERKAARVAAAGRLGVPVDEDGLCHFPDALIEVEDESGQGSSLALELATGSYSARQVRAKLAMGMVLAFTGGSRSRRMLGRMARSFWFGSGKQKLARAQRPGRDFEERLFDVMGR